MPVATSFIDVLRRPVESAQATSTVSTDVLKKTVVADTIRDSTAPIASRSYAYAELWAAAR